MANPSLQIGDSNWAIKEDNLLGYSKAGTRFVPQPITMTRASAGTRVNSEGLVETVELLGSEEVTNWDMELDCCWANYASGTTTNERSTEQVYESNYSRKYATTTATTGGIQSDNFTTSTGVTYNVSFWVYPATGTSQRIAVRKGDNSGWAVDNTFSGLTQNSWNNCTITYTETVGGSTAFIAFHSNAVVGTWYIDNVSVKESTKNNLARVDYTDGTSSLLVEPERTNLITNSEDFSGWSSYVYGGGNLAKTYGYESPNGLYNATKFEVTLGTGGVLLTDNITVGATENYTLSVWMKGEVGGEKVKIDLKNTGSDGPSGETFTLTTDWIRYEVTRTNDGATNRGFQFRVTVGEISSDQTFYVYGAQLEEGSYGTSYIPTDGTTVTRIQDQYEKTGISNLINSEEGVLFLEMAALSNDLTTRLISLSDGSDTNRIHCFYFSASNTIALNYRVSGTTRAGITASLGDETDFKKIAFRWESGNFKLYIDGVPSGTDANTTMLPAGTLNSLKFSRGDGIQNFFGKVKQLQVYDTALTDSELVTLTT